jgi:hypothetical protein
MRALLDAASVMPRIRRYAERRGITVRQAELDREIAALQLLLAADDERLARTGDMPALNAGGQVRS